MQTNNKQSLKKINPKFTNSYLLLILVAICCSISQSALPTISTTEVLTGIINPFVTTCQINTIYSFVQAYSIPSFLTTIVKGFGLGIIGFEGIIQSAIYIKVDRVQVNSTHFSMNIQCRDQTILSKLRYHYIIYSNLTNFLQVYNDCFLCANQTTQIDGSNTYNFSLQNHIRPYNPLTINIMTSIYAINITNYYSPAYEVTTKTWMISGSPVINQQIKTYSKNYLVSICLSTLIYDSAQSLNALYLYSIVFKMGKGEVNSNLKLTGILPQPSNPTLQFYNAHAMYFGISSINKLSLNNGSKIFMLFNPNDLLSMNTNFQSNSNLANIQISYFYSRRKNCAAPNNKYISTIMDCVATCPAPLQLNTLTSNCEVCYYKCLTCDGTSFDDCKTCDVASNFRQRLVGGTANTQCKCRPGYFEPATASPICLKCSDYMPFCTSCIISTFCITCTSSNPTRSNMTFNSSSGINKCQCTNPTNTYINQGICSPFAGCDIVNSSINQPIYCTSCNASRHFVLLANDTCACDTPDWEQSPDRQECVDYCGDGKVYTNACDDNNTVNKDGCSSMCTIETQYSCHYDANQRKSICALDRGYVLSYKSCRREIGSNSATFFFSIQPPDQLLTLFSFKEFVSFSFRHVVSSTSYDINTGILSITTSYEQTLEQTQQSVKVKFNWNYVNNPEINLTFTINGVNAWVNMDKNANLYNIIMYLAMILCFLVWGVALTASILGYRNIGMELVYPVQAIYFVLVSVNIKSPGIKSLEFFSLANGYNLINGLQLKQFSQNGDNQFIYLEYMLNYNYFIVVNFVCFVCLFICHKMFNKMSESMLILRNKQSHIINLIKNNKKLTKQEQSHKLTIENNYKSYEKSKLFLQYAGHRIFTPILLYSVQGAVYFTSIFVYYKLISNEYPLLVNILACVLSLLMAMVTLIINPSFQKNEKLIPQNKKQYSYSFEKIYIAQYLVFIIILSAISALQIQILVILPIIILLSTVFYIHFKNPYLQIYPSGWNKHLLLIQQIVLTIPLISIWILSLFNNYQSMIYFMVVIVVVGGVSFSIVISICRIYLEYRVNNTVIKKSQKQKMKRKMEVDKMKIAQNMQKELIQQGKIQSKQTKQNQNDEKNQIIEEITPLQMQLMQKEQNQAKLSARTQNQSVDDNQSENIQLIKKKLRNDIKSRRRVLAK